MASIVDKVKDYVSETKEQVQSHFQEKKQKIGNVIKSWAKQKFKVQAMELVDRIPGIIKRNIDDPAMPNCVRAPLFRGISNIWPDFRQEILWELAVLIDGDTERTESKVYEMNHSHCCLRAFFRYHLFPYDKGFWSTVRDPLWLLVNILAFVPYKGIFAYTFLLTFCVIDLSDEYQLIYFILSFKGCQFVSWGLIKGILGYATYFICVTFPEFETLKTVASGSSTTTTVNLNRCEEWGPGMTEEYVIQIVSWLLPLALVWIAFALLPLSKEKGRSVIKDDDEPLPADVLRQRQGGYIRNILIFDIIIFLLCVALLAIIVAVQPRADDEGIEWDKTVSATKSDWQIHQTFFFCQFIYGLFSIVWVPFTIPFLQAVLTHSVPTAYDREGRCVKFKGAAIAKETEEVSEETQKNVEVSPEEVDGLATKFQKILKGESVDLNVNELIQRRRSPTSAATEGAATEGAATEGAATDGAATEGAASV